MTHESRTTNHGLAAVAESCPTPDPFTRANCKRRACPYCGRLWAWDWERVMRTNLEDYGGAVRMVAITAPGSDALPWACERDHEHSGARGCRVEASAANEWASTVSQRWKELREDARIATIRATGLKPTLLLRVWEPQKRGVPHLHIVLGVATEPEKIAAERFRRELDERAAYHGFGYVQRHVHEVGAHGAARYLVGYLLGRSKRKGTIRENIAHPRMPRSLIWLTPNLTRSTLCTMRRLRYARWYLAAFRGRASQLPSLYGELAVDVAHVVTLLERERGRQDEDDDHDRTRAAPDPARVRFHLRTMQTMRRLRLAQVAA